MATPIHVYIVYFSLHFLYPLQVSEAYEMVYAKVNFVKTFDLSASPSLLWYLREEPMEMQIILSSNAPVGGANNKNSNSNNNSNNAEESPSTETSAPRIIGTIQLRLDALVTQTPDIHGSTEVGGDYPVFHRDADALEGACVSFNARLETEDTPTRDGAGRATPSTLSRRGSVDDVGEIGAETRVAGVPSTLAGTNDGTAR